MSQWQVEASLASHIRLQAGSIEDDLLCLDTEVSFTDWWCWDLRLQRDVSSHIPTRQVVRSEDQHGSPQCAIYVKLFLKKSFQKENFYFTKKYSHLFYKRFQLIQPGLGRTVGCNIYVLWMRCKVWISKFLSQDNILFSTCSWRVFKENLAKNLRLKDISAMCWENIEIKCSKTCFKKCFIIIIFPFFSPSWNQSAIGAVHLGKVRGATSPSSGQIALVLTKT